jgi:hypothetical protein
MLKIYSLLTITFLLFGVGSVNAQFLDGVKVKKEKLIRCYTVENMREARALYPNAETEEQFEAWMANMTAQRKANRGNAITDFTVPVIFHIIHGGQAVGTTPNISADIIRAQVNMLNNAFGNKDGSRYAAASRTGITFALAASDPTGAPLPVAGINRVNYVTRGWTNPGTTGWTQTYINSTIKAQTIWNPENYLNMWIVPIIQNNILGYATFPTGSTLQGLTSGETATNAGLVIATPTAGSTFTPSTCDPSDGFFSYNMGKTMVHEVGHFFGLRHIWGDAACGNDYCDDTPVHEDANVGTPTHPKSNTCGTADEMFENYMDYTDDIAMNTFTLNQVDRIQTVMLNSPRRKLLPASPAGFVAVPPSSKIAFITNCTDSTTVSERATATNSTQSYHDDTLFVTTDNQATDVGTLSFSTSGSAINGVDYEILTPAINYSIGDAVKTVIVRILDNAAVDGPRKIVLTLNPSGPGISAGTERQTYTINITDDDNVLIGQNPVNLLSENFENAGANLPVGWRLLTTTGYINRFVVSANGNATSGTTGTGQCAHITNNTTTKPNVYTRGVSGAAVLQSIEIDPSNVQSLDSLKFKYRIRGRGTVTSPIDYGMVMYTIGQDPATITNWSATPSLTGAGPYCTNLIAGIANAPSLAVPEELNNQKFAVNFYFETGASTNGGDPGLNIDDVILTATPYTIETAVSSSSAYRLPPTLNNNFRSPNKKQIAAIANASDAVESLVASVSEAGNDRPTFATDVATYMRSRKVITLAPAAPNTTTTYTATFYFTQAEVAAWGGSVSNLKIIKLDGATSFSSPLNEGNAQVVTPTSVNDKLATDGYISYTATFTGFGKFALVEESTLLPLRLLTFTGALRGNVVNLRWKTSNETNTKGFDVQKSTDGVNFKAISFVNGQNGTNNQYALNDEKIEKGNKYYYRLKMVDLDEKFTISPVVTITYLDKNKWFFVYPNPVKDELIVQNSFSTTQNAEIIISEVSGKVVYQSRGLVSSRTLIATTNWSSGTYFIKIRANDNETVMKVVKQ